MDVWTWGYFPFTIAGNEERPVKCNLSVVGPFDLGYGYMGHITISPKGNTYIVESSTGGIIGDSVKKVKNDIETGDPEVMRRQIVESRMNMEKAERVSFKEFWSMFKGE